MLEAAGFGGGLDEAMPTRREFDKFESGALARPG